MFNSTANVARSCSLMLICNPSGHACTNKRTKPTKCPSAGETEEKEIECISQEVEESNI